MNAKVDKLYEKSITVCTHVTFEYFEVLQEHRYHKDKEDKTKQKDSKETA